MVWNALTHYVESQPRNGLIRIDPLATPFHTQLRDLAHEHIHVLMNHALVLLDVAAAEAGRQDLAHFTMFNGVPLVEDVGHVAVVVEDAVLEERQARPRRRRVDVAVCLHRRERQLVRRYAYDVAL